MLPDERGIFVLLRDSIERRQMTTKERVVAAFDIQVPDKVPTFELEFQLEEEMFGRKFITDELGLSALRRLSEKERNIRLAGLVEYIVDVYTKLEYSIIPAASFCGILDWVGFDRGEINDEFRLTVRMLRERVGDSMMIAFHGDGTFGIPDGSHMAEFSYELADDPAGVKERARALSRNAIERNKRLQDMGIDCLFLCADYCYNSGPFISPEMFGEFIQPYLHEIIRAARKDGLYTVKHTDGNIMPILDQLVDCNPHALHSLDPMAGVDIREVKRRVGNRVCLCGNVHCAALQTGTDEEVVDSAVYCLTHGKPGGGYVFCTSNIPFRGMRPERYSMILDVWKQHRNY